MCSCTPTRGDIINQRASTGAQVVVLRAHVPELEKLARRTPPKTLATERAKVEAAKGALLVARAKLAILELRWFDLKEREAVLSPSGAPAKSEG